MEQNCDQYAFTDHEIILMNVIILRRRIAFQILESDFYQYNDEITEFY